MTRIAINFCLKELKKNKRMVFTEETLLMENVPVMPEIYRKMKTEELLSILDNLPAAYRIVFNLHLIEGYSHKEISAMLDIRESTSRTKLTRARKMLQDYLFVSSKKSIV
jgi:RNA polymerase sigma-70 factor (ECF subfamily)